jgi:hypothetical protein
MYKIFSFAGLGLLLALLFLRLDTRDGVYAMSPSKVNSVIDQTTLPLQLFGVSNMTAKHWRADAATSMWALLDGDGAETLRFSAVTSVEGDGARVSVSVLPPVGVNSARMEQTLRDNESNADLYKVALSEQIDAKINHRDFDPSHLSQAAARVAITSLPNIRKSVDAAAKAHERQEQEGVDSAYANEK